MVTVLSYIALLIGALVVTLTFYLGLLKRIQYKNLNLKTKNQLDFS